MLHATGNAKARTPFPYQSPSPEFSTSDLKAVISNTWKQRIVWHPQHCTCASRCQGLLYCQIGACMSYNTKASLPNKDKNKLDPKPRILHSWTLKPSPRDHESGGLHGEGLDVLPSVMWLMWLRHVLSSEPSGFRVAASVFSYAPVGV